MTTEIERELKEFYDTTRAYRSHASLLRMLLKYSEEIRVPIAEWNKDILTIYLKSLESVSLDATHVNITLFNKYYCFSRAKQNKEPLEIKFTIREIYDILDLNSLIKKTLTKEGYDSLLLQMRLQTINNSNNTPPFNIRDLVIFQLAWLGLSQSEIKLLKKDDIFFKKHNDKDLAIIKTATNEYVSIDSEFIKDVKKCFNCNVYYIVAKNGSAKEHFLLESDYLIRPVKVGRVSESDGTVRRVTTILQESAKKSLIAYKDFDLMNLTAENLRRSKIIYMFSLDHGVKNNTAFVAEQYNIKSSSLIVFMKKISKIIYGERK